MNHQMNAKRMKRYPAWIICMKFANISWILFRQFQIISNIDGELTIKANCECQKEIASSWLKNNLIGIVLKNNQEELDESVDGVKNRKEIRLAREVNRKRLTLSNVAKPTETKQNGSYENFLARKWKISLASIVFPHQTSFIMLIVPTACLGKLWTQFSLSSSLKPATSSCWICDYIEGVPVHMECRQVSL